MFIAPEFARQAVKAASDFEEAVARLAQELHAAECVPDCPRTPRPGDNWFAYARVIYVDGATAQEQKHD